MCLNFQFLLRPPKFRNSNFSCMISVSVCANRGLLYAYKSSNPRQSGKLESNVALCYRGWRLLKQKINWNSSCNTVKNIMEKKNFCYIHLNNVLFKFSPFSQKWLEKCARKFHYIYKRKNSPSGTLERIDVQRMTKIEKAQKQCLSNLELNASLNCRSMLTVWSKIYIY